jgi:hypothetical protein
MDAEQPQKETTESFQKQKESSENGTIGKIECIEEISEEEDQDDDDAISKNKMSVAEISFNDSRRRSFDEMSQDGTFHTAPDEQEVSKHILIGDKGPEDALEEMDDANVTTFQLHVEESKLNEEDLLEDEVLLEEGRIRTDPEEQSSKELQDQPTNNNATSEGDVPPPDEDGGNVGPRTHSQQGRSGGSKGRPTRSHHHCSRRS